MSRSLSRRLGGFTLVELLVVIAIIGTLAALLLPAITRAREAARQTECMNNQRQIASAMLQYDTAKGRFPGFVTYKQPGGAVLIGWVPPLFPYLGKNEIYQLANYGTASPTKINFLTCPSRAITTSAAPLSYAVNCGRLDSATTPFDSADNGVFFNTTAASPPVTQTSSYISRRDGVAHTIMFSENLDTQDWTVPADISEWRQGILWYPATSISPALNKSGGLGLANYGAGRPSSVHPGTFGITFCDQHFKLFGDDIDYRVYALLMTPNGNASISYVNEASSPPTGVTVTGEPVQTVGATTKYPTAWLQGATAGNPLIPLNESDLR